jgi:AcrR family transcriptional regulator
MAENRRRRAGRPSAAASAATRERILRAACACFAASGYAQARNQEIAEAAGVTSAALYHYYDSKAELFGAVYRGGLELITKSYREAAAGRRGAIDKLCAMVESNVAMNREHPGLADFLAIAPLELKRHPELAARVGEAGLEVPALFREVLEEGVRSGELRRDLPVETAVHLVTAASYGLSWVHGLLASPAEHDAAVRAFQALLRGRLFESRALGARGNSQEESR